MPAKKSAKPKKSTHGKAPHKMLASKELGKVKPLALTANVITTANPTSVQTNAQLISQTPTTTNPISGVKAVDSWNPPQ